MNPYFLSLFTECTGAGFAAGIVGNLVASGIQWGSTASVENLRQLISDGQGKALKNHDLVRAMLIAQTQATIEIIEIVLLEELGVDSDSRSKRLVAWFKRIGTPESDQVERDIEVLRTLRNELLEFITLVPESRDLAKLDSQLALAIEESPVIASQDIKRHLDDEYQVFLKRAALGVARQLKTLNKGEDIPSYLSDRLMTEQWLEFVRAAFREQIKSNEKAKTAYFINAHDDLLILAKQNHGGLETLKTLLEEAFEKTNSRIELERRQLDSLRDRLNNLDRDSSRDHATTRRELTSMSGEWSKFQIALSARLEAIHETAKDIRKEQQRTSKKLERLAQGQVEFGKALAGVANAMPKSASAAEIMDQAEKKAESGDLIKALELATEAARVADLDLSPELRWKSRLYAVRCATHAILAQQIHAGDRVRSQAKMNQFIQEARLAGAPESKILVGQMLHALADQDLDSILRLTADIQACKTAVTSDKIEALALRVEVLTQKERYEDALELNEIVEAIRTDLDYERIIFLDGEWLLLLLKAGIALSADFDNYIATCRGRELATVPETSRQMSRLIQRALRFLDEKPPSSNDRGKLIQRFRKIGRLRPLDEGEHQLLVQRAIEGIAASLDEEQVQIFTNYTPGDSEEELIAFAQRVVSTKNQSAIGLLRELFNDVQGHVPDEVLDAKAQIAKICKAAYEILEPREEPGALVHWATQLAQLSAEALNHQGVIDWTGKCLLWAADTSKSSDELSTIDRCGLRIDALRESGKAYLCLAQNAAEQKILTNELPTLLERAIDYLNQSYALIEENRRDLDTNVEVLLAETALRQGEAESLAGRTEIAAARYEAAHSPPAMAHAGYRRGNGAIAWLKEAEAKCFSGDPDGASSVLNAITTAPDIPGNIISQCDRLQDHLKYHVQPLSGWFVSEHANRIRAFAKKNGLRSAIAAQTKFLFDWHDTVWKGQNSLGPAYDFWGRGGFSRIVAAVKARPNSAILIDATCVSQICTAARMLCPLFETVLVLWKGTILERGVSASPDPAPVADQFGDFFGGMGYIRCADSILITPGSNTLPDDLGLFMAGEARSLIESGRLVVLPAPFVGCTQTAIGWTDDMLGRMLLNGVLHVTCGSVASSEKQPQFRSNDVMKMPIPFIDGVSMEDLALILEDSEDYLGSLRGLLASSFSSDLGNERWGAIKTVEANFNEASRKLKEIYQNAKRPKTADWKISTISGVGGVSEPGNYRIGLDENTDRLRALCPQDSTVLPWIPLLRLENAGGYLDWSCELDNPTAPAAETPMGRIQQTWLYPGTGGPGMVVMRRG